MNRILVFPFLFSAFVGPGGPGDGGIVSSAPAEEPRTVLITGANRGLGLEFARRFDALGYNVIGTARKPGQATSLAALGVRVEQLDVTDEASVSDLAVRLEGTTIDILINNGGGHYSYCASKAALNQITVTLAQELEDDGFTCVVLHPGWVRTRMGGESATFSPEESVEGMVNVILNLTPADTGHFLDLHGKEVPW